MSSEAAEDARKEAEEAVKRQAAQEADDQQAQEAANLQEAADLQVQEDANLQAAQATADNAEVAQEENVAQDSRAAKSAGSKKPPNLAKDPLKQLSDKDARSSHAGKTKKDKSKKTTAAAQMHEAYAKMASRQGAEAAAHRGEDTDVVMEDDMDVEPDPWQSAPQDPDPQDPHSEQTLREPDEDDEGPASYTTCNREESENPRGSKTVAWGRRGHSTFYINRKGPAASGYHRIESQPIFEKGGAIDWRKNPPDELCVSNIENRLGELKFGKTYVHKDIHGIYGVAFRAKLDKTFPSCMIPKGHEYELLNHDNYQEWECTHGRKPRFVPCYVRVGWKTADGQIVKSWELRRALQVPVRWGPEKTDDAVYQLAKMHYKRQMEADNPEDYPSSRDPTPAYPAPHHRQPLSPPIRRWGSPTIDIQPSVEDPRHHHQPLATSYRSTSRELTPESRPRSRATTSMVSQNGPSQEQSDVDAAIETYKQMYLDEHNASSIFELPAKAKSDLLMTILDFKKSVNV
ncbi:hypothetical protein M011DRAFT_470475 [Sporormia fimetaria CBS 119925]|uniref:Uncharacterized protein n=1 Tax=Sporormia fimetaria CBS 119925 TaxID=1340428 RepID=A0A6A6V1K2_9PLEO|nr:hypothetical protein M011DRAFT_470475 [Sporormia fimetaria CBS 119925]